MELLITMAISMIVIAGTMVFYVSTAKSSTQNSSTVRLNQELRSAMDLISRDIRRAGYRGNAQNCVGVGYSNYVNSGTTTCSAFAAYTLTSTSQIEFSYDENSSATQETSSPDERYGYRLNSGEIEVKTGGGWQPLTDANLVTITNLNFAESTRHMNVNTSAAVSGGCASIAGTPCVSVRTISITITGQLPNDATVQRTLSENARIRNDAFSI